ncbi:MAG: GNAT family N-acetyltransferase [Caldilineaceae bacterium]|nr:GNAT family N-acetyltransferase [Caldilineaceae bacterium]
MTARDMAKLGQAMAPAMAATMRVVTPAPRHVWRAVVQADPWGLMTQTPEWIDCICASGEFEDASRLYEMASGKQLILPMVRRRHLPTMLAWEASPPSGWGMGGLIASAPIDRAEIAAVFADLQRSGGLRVSIRPNPLQGDLWAQARPSRALALPRFAHVLDLEGGFETVWKTRFAGNTRNQVRKAERSGLVVECDTTGKLVPIYYNLYLKSLARWAEQQHEPLALALWRGKRRDPLAKLQSMAQKLGPSCQVWMAWLDGQPVAGIIVLRGANAHYTRGAMDKDLAGPTYANDLLHRLAIEDACRDGCHYYHMGESGLSASLARFKARFGAEGMAYAEYRLERLPITRADTFMRQQVKRLIRFKDA